MQRSTQVAVRSSALAAQRFSDLLQQTLQGTHNLGSFKVFHDNPKGFLVYRHFWLGRVQAFGNCCKRSPDRPTCCLLNHPLMARRANMSCGELRITRRRHHLLQRSRAAMYQNEHLPMSSDVRKTKRSCSQNVSSIPSPRTKQKELTTMNRTSRFIC